MKLNILLKLLFIEEIILIHEVENISLIKLFKDFILCSRYICVDETIISLNIWELNRRNDRQQMKYNNDQIIF
jgi:hypothetical protein